MKNLFDTGNSIKKQVMTNLGDITFEMMQEKAKPFVKLMSYYRCAMMEIETKLRVLNEEYSLEHDRNPISSIKTRLKSASSMKEKLRRKNIPLSLENVEKNINDVAGIRVICNSPDDVYLLADSLLMQDDITLVEKKDYIANPKANGYRSLHLIVAIPIFLAHSKRIMKVEIQLRTMAMDFWASLEHQLRYKKNHEFTDEMADELYQCAQLSAELDLRMQALRKKVEEEHCPDERMKKIYPNMEFNINNMEE